MLDGKQVLIVEDDPVTAVVLQGMLRKLGAVAVVRDEAAYAWKALCEQPFDQDGLALGIRSSRPSAADDRLHRLHRAGTANE